MVNELSEKAKEARRAYKRAWNRRNPDKVKAAQARYWERRAKEMQEAEDNATQPEKAIPI